MRTRVFYSAVMLLFLGLFFVSSMFSERYEFFRCSIFFYAVPIVHCIACITNPALAGDKRIIIYITLGAMVPAFLSRSDQSELLLCKFIAIIAGFALMLLILIIFGKFNENISHD